ncbi:Thioesterase superfamily protein [Hyphomicrobiales bacterium]|nr:Thioesterase superfamily protein [Hyphomicrobiales bacterium]CAH1666589.1 Acyl-CoA hydrolase [Hyphomicrobiales bacterium]
MQAIGAQRSEARFLEVVLPEQANHYGTLYGANALHIMGKAAFICATRHARCAVVMAKAETIEFVRPIRIGSIIDIRARIVEQGRSSMTVVVDILPDNPDAPEATPSVTGRFMMVAVDDDGAPMLIPPTVSLYREDIRS